MQDITEVKKMLAEAEALDNEWTEIRRKASALRIRARELCPHLVTETKEQYFSGSYSDRASNVTTTLCAICGVVLSKKTETMA